MPFMICKAKKVVLKQDTFMQLIRIFRKKKRNLDNVSFKAVYVLVGDDKDVDSITPVGTLVVLVSVNGGPVQFTHLWGRDINDMLDAFHPELSETEHRIRLDHQCCIDDFHGTYYNRY